MAVLRVDPIVGNNSNPYAAVAGGAAWAHPDVARAEALQGDLVLVYDNGADFLYTAPASNNRFDPAHQIANALGSTEEGQRITFRAAGNHRVYLGTTGGTGPVIGASAGRAFVTWEGFYIDENDYVWQSDTGPCVYAGGSDNYFLRIHVQGRADAAGVADNHCAYRGEDTLRMRMIDCTAVDFFQGGWGNWSHNNAGAMFYGARDYLVEHCDFIRCGSGLFPKGTAQSGAIFNYGVTRYSQFRQCGKAMRSTFLHASSLSEFYQNLIWDAHPDEDFNNQRVGAEINESARNLHVYNNTIAMRIALQSNTSDGTHANIRAYNNILMGDGTARVVNLGEANLAGASMWEMDYNLYHDSLGWSLNGSNIATIEDWRVALGGAGDWNANNSFLANPLFVDALTGNFHLQEGSPADGAGFGGVPLGPFITGAEIMGVRPLGGSPPPSAFPYRVARLGKRLVYAEI